MIFLSWYAALLKTPLNTVLLCMNTSVVENNLSSSNSKIRCYCEIYPTLCGDLCVRAIKPHAKNHPVLNVFVAGAILVCFCRFKLPHLHACFSISCPQRALWLLTRSPPPSNFRIIIQTMNAQKNRVEVQAYQVSHATMETLPVAASWEWGGCSFHLGWFPFHSFIPPFVSSLHSPLKVNYLEIVPDYGSTKKQPIDLFLAVPTSAVSQSLHTGTEVCPLIICCDWSIPLMPSLPPSL